MEKTLGKVVSADHSIPINKNGKDSLPDPSLAVNKDEYYKKVFSPDTIERQIINLCQVLDIQWPDLKMIKGLPEFPESENITGFAVVIDYNYLDAKTGDYSVALQRLLKLMFHNHIRIQTDLTGRIVGKFGISPITRTCLNICPSIGPFKLFPIHTGHKWLRYSARESRIKMQEVAKQRKRGWIEFPLCTFDCLCLFASHHQRMTQRDNVLPQCSGDIFCPSGSGNGFFSTRIVYNNSGRRIDTVYDQKVDRGISAGRYSTWTGFVKK